MQNIGFIGLGAMGAPMARNLHRAGFGLTVWNRSKARSESFARDGIPVAESPAILAGASDTVIIMVSDPAALEAVLPGVLSGLREGGCVVNMSTVSVAATHRAAAAVREHGSRFVDAPVSGTVKPAEDGTLVVLAGAATADLEDVQPILDALGRQTIHCGLPGQGTRMKLVINLMLGGMMGLLAEGLNLGQRGGLDPELVLDAVAGGPLGAPLYAMKGRMMLDGRFDKQFPLDLLYKDMTLMFEEAAAQGLPLYASAAVREMISAARGAGYGDEDMAALYKLLQQG